MIRGYVLGFSKPSQPIRYGDAELIQSTRGKYNLLIDGYCGKGTNKLIVYLKKRKIKNLYLALSHAHYDHWYGLREIIRDPYFNVKCLYCYDPNTLKGGLRNNKGSISVREDIEGLENLIEEAKAKGIKVIFLKHGDKITLGDIKINIYRQQPLYVADDDTEGWSYVNDGSLCFYFPDLYYWTSGDGSERIWDFIKSLGIKVKYFKIPHHGNNCTMSQARGLKSQGVNVCWYNHLEPDGVGTTEFTAYGARRCKEAGITVLDCIGDINWIAYNGKIYIYHKGKNVTNYACPYSGASELKHAASDIVRKVFEGVYGYVDDRVTNLIDAGYYFGSTQSKVNKVINVAVQIISGKVDYGANEERIKNLDQKFGRGYGQLIQDEINSLLDAKSKKW